MRSSEFVYVIFIRTTPEKLFDALRKPEFTRIWWAETEQKCDWSKNSRWEIFSPDGVLRDSGEVLEYDPPRRFVISWRNEFIPEMKKEGYSRATFELEQMGDTVKLTITHEMDHEGSTLIHGVSQGWPPLLSSLKSLLESGEALEITRKWKERA